MANAASFPKKEWEQIHAAPEWVFAAISAADARKGKANLKDKKEIKGYGDAIRAYKSRAELVKEVIENSYDAPDVGNDSTVEEALKQLAQVNRILIKNGIERTEADDYRDFLMDVAHAVAESDSEKMLGLGKDKISEDEQTVLDQLVDTLEATAAHKRARLQAETKAKIEAQKKQEELDKIVKETAEKQRKAAAAAKKKQAELEAAREEKEAEAKKAQAAAERKKRAEEKRKAAAAKVEAARKALEEKRAAEAAAKEAEAARIAEEEAAAAEAEAAAAEAEAKYEDFLATHTVKGGENLSKISEQYYGHQFNWKAIYEANMTTIGDNPNIVIPGQVLNIPKL